MTPEQSYAARRGRLDNLVLLCSRHHRALHEEGFAVRVGNGARRSSAGPTVDRSRTLHPPPAGPGRRWRRLTCIRPPPASKSDPTRQRRTGTASGSTSTTRSTSCGGRGPRRAPERMCRRRRGPAPKCYARLSSLEQEMAQPQSVAIGPSLGAGNRPESLAMVPENVRHAALALWDNDVDAAGTIPRASPSPAGGLHTGGSRTRIRGRRRSGCTPDRPGRRRRRHLTRLVSYPRCAYRIGRHSRGRPIHDPSGAAAAGTTTATRV